MARPHTRKKLCCRPGHIVFGRWRAGYNICRTMPADAFETIRLIDYEDMTQAEAASSMGCSRTTVQRLYSFARHLIAAALIEGTHIKVEIDDHIHVTPDGGEDISRKEDTLMKVVFALEGQNIAPHYGKAKEFMLCTVENGEVLRKDRLIPDTDHMGGCRRFMMSLGVEAFVAGAMAKDAHRRYLESGMTVYEAKGAVEKALEAFLKGALVPMETFTEDTDCHGDARECCAPEEDACCEDKKGYPADDCCHD